MDPQMTQNRHLETFKTVCEFDLREFLERSEHVSYRKRRAVFVGTTRHPPAAKSCRHVRHLLTVPFILRRCQRPKSMAPRYLPVEIDLQSSKSSKNHRIDLGTILDPRGAPEDPQRTPRGPQRGPRRPSEHSQRTNRGPTEDQQRTKRGPREDQQGTNRHQQATNREPTEDHQGTNRSRPEGTTASNSSSI